MQGFNGVSTMVLVPAVVDAIRVPVLAAGGIGDSRGYKAAFALGAAGVQVGTRFIASKECIAHGNYKNFIVDSPENGTRLVDMERFQVRALNTPLVEKMMTEKNLLDTSAGAALEESWVKGDLAAGVLPAGQISGLISRISSVREIIEEMISD